MKNRGNRNSIHGACVIPEVFFATTTAISVESNSCIIYNFFGPDPVFCFFDALDVIGVLSVTSEWVRLLCMVAVLFWDNFFTLLNIL